MTAMSGRWLLLALLAAACSSDDTIKERYQFQDSAGRTCQATLEKTRPGAPSVNQSVSCDGEAKACSGESSACFVLSVDTASEEIRSCPACCKGNSSSFIGTECAVVVCEADADCVYAEARCESELCRCPGGYCE
ncbi:MAG TPA: hypothetical protein VEX18_05840 [Polyangiaceae bacterium]|nr:hypothetical protein [Polyangiaceae bacterium]